MPDAILFWNEVALEANRVDFAREMPEQGGPTLSSRALAIVHLAMYDTYAAIDPTAGAAYLPGLPPPPPGASAPAAVAGAAHAALLALYPSQEAFFNQRLSQAGDVLNPGHNFGVRVARALLEDRAADPGAGSAGYVPSLARGYHREDPDNPGQGFHAPFYGARSRPFAVTARHELDPPPFIIPATGAYDPEYESALRQVRGLGIAPELMGTLLGGPLPTGFGPRTPEQTLVGIYWGYDGAAGLGTPPRLYNQVLRRVAMTRSPGSPTTPNSEAENARLFALVNAAMGDAGILAWDQKYCHDFWRPVVGIREHDPALGLATAADDDLSADADPGWLPLGAPATNSKNPAFRPVRPGYPCNQSLSGIMKNFTPNFPAYPSGHATFGAAAFHIARLFYGVGAGDRDPDDLFDGLAFVSDEFNGVNQDNRGTVRPRHLRAFPDGLWGMILENALSRIYLGVHWIFDAYAVDEDGDPDLNRNVGGVPLGLTIAEDIYAAGLTRSPEGPRATPCARDFDDPGTMPAAKKASTSKQRPSAKKRR